MGFWGLEVCRSLDKTGCGEVKMKIEEEEAGRFTDDADVNQHEPWTQLESQMTFCDFRFWQKEEKYGNEKETGA